MFDRIEWRAFFNRTFKYLWADMKKMSTSKVGTGRLSLFFRSLFIKNFLHYLFLHHCSHTQKSLYLLLNAGTTNVETKMTPTTQCWSSGNSNNSRVRRRFYVCLSFLTMSLILTHITFSFLWFFCEFIFRMNVWVF